MHFSGLPKSGNEEPKPDSPPAAIPLALARPTDPEDPLEQETAEIILPDENAPIAPGDEPPAPGEGP